MALFKTRARTRFSAIPVRQTDARGARKCDAAALNGATVALLTHARTDTRRFHDWVYQREAEIRFVRGRLKFGDGKQSALFRQSSPSSNDGRT